MTQNNVGANNYSPLHLFCTKSYELCLIIVNCKLLIINYFTAIVSISTNTFMGNVLTANAALAGASEL